MSFHPRMKKVVQKTRLSGPQETNQSCNCFSAKLSFRDNWNPERCSDSLKVTLQKRIKDGLQARDLSTESWKNQPIQRHLSPGSLLPLARTSFPHNNALFGFPFPPSFPLKKTLCPASRSPQGLQCEQRPFPQAGTRTQK